MLENALVWTTKGFDNRDDLRFSETSFAASGLHVVLGLGLEQLVSRAS